MKKKNQRRSWRLRAQSLVLSFVLCAALIGPAAPAFAGTEASGEGQTAEASLEESTAESSPAEESPAESSSAASPEEGSTAESRPEESSPEENSPKESSPEESSPADVESTWAADVETQAATEAQPEEYEVLIEEAVEEGQIQDPEQALSAFTLYASVQRGTTTANVNFRYGPGTDYASMGTVPEGKTLTILGDGKDSKGTVWFLITYNGKQGYVSGQYIDLFTMEVGDDPAFEAELEAQGFPESYKEKLRILHAQYPTWKFVKQDAGSWDTAMEEETWYNTNGPSGDGSTQAVSLVDKNSIASWKSTGTGAFDWATGEWVTGWDGSSWVVASDEIVAYYLDPRNFLDDTSVFQFLDLSDTNTTAEAIRQLAASKGADWLTGTYQHENGDSINYPQVILEAGKAAGYNPLALVASLIQELGTNGAGRETISGTVAEYPGLYNYFNIGAFTDNTFSKAYLRGLWVAGGGNSGSTSWGRPWDTREKALYGGAEYFAEYVTKYGQDTLYLKKFDVLPSSHRYEHQYATNIQMADAEGRILAGAYSEDLRKGTLVFQIPVYSGMPSEACDMPMDDTNPASSVRGFVVRLYQNILGREPEAEGLSAWVHQLVAGNNTAAEVAYGFVFSEEYQNRNASSREYIQMLYQTVLGRLPKDSEIQAWQSVLDKGLTRKHVFSGFINSEEFTKLCQQYEVTRGTYKSDHILDQNENVTAFVTRMYTVCLKRSSTEEERSSWVRVLLDHSSSGRDITYGFFDSREFTGKNLSNGEFVTRLYQTLFDREPDTAGYNAWIRCLERGDSRNSVIEGFVDSVEFDRLCKRFGITR